MKKVRVLVVDDNKDFCHIMCEYIDMQPDMVALKAAYDGLTAFRSIIWEQPDIVLLDYIIPNMDGLELLEQMKNTDIIRKPAFIMLTATGEWTRISRKALELGAADFIVKPMSLDKIAKCIRNTISCGKFNTCTE